jgi:hypothetical protein
MANSTAPVCKSNSCVACSVDADCTGNVSGNICNLSILSMNTLKVMLLLEIVLVLQALIATHRIRRIIKIKHQIKILRKIKISQQITNKRLCLAL